MSTTDTIRCVARDGVRWPINGRNVHIGAGQEVTIPRAEYEQNKAIFALPADLEAEYEKQKAAEPDLAAQSQREYEQVIAQRVAVQKERDELAAARRAQAIDRLKAKEAPTEAEVDRRRGARDKFHGGAR